MVRVCYLIVLFLPFASVFSQEDKPLVNGGIFNSITEIGWSKLPVLANTSNSVSAILTHRNQLFSSVGVVGHLMSNKIEIGYEKFGFPYHWANRIYSSVCIKVHSNYSVTGGVLYENISVEGEKSKKTFSGMTAVYGRISECFLGKVEVRMNEVFDRFVKSKNELHLELRYLASNRFHLILKHNSTKLNRSTSWIEVFYQTKSKINFSWAWNLKDYSQNLAVGMNFKNNILRVETEFGGTIGERIKIILQRRLSKN